MGILHKKIHAITGDGRWKELLSLASRNIYLLCGLDDEYQNSTKL